MVNYKVLLKLLRLWRVRLKAEGAKAKEELACGNVGVYWEEGESLMEAAT